MIPHYFLSSEGGCAKTLHFLHGWDKHGSLLRLDCAHSTDQTQRHQTIAVGVGSDTNATELATIASSKNDVFRLDEFEELKFVIENLTPAQCKGNVSWSYVKPF